MIKIKNIEILLQENARYFFNAARVEHKNSYKLIVQTQNGWHNVVITSRESVIALVPNFSSKSIKGLYRLVESAIQFANSQFNPVLEEGFKWLPYPDSAIDRWLRYCPENGTLKGQILKNSFYIETDTPIKEFSEDEIVSLVEAIAKRIFEQKMENISSGQLFERLQTTASNLVNPSDNDIVEQGCDDIVYIDFEGWFC